MTIMNIRIVILPIGHGIFDSTVLMPIEYLAGVTVRQNVILRDILLNILNLYLIFLPGIFN